MKACMKCGGSMKKYAAGGSTPNKLNKPKAPTKPTLGGSNVKMGIYGVPNAGPTGPNIQGVNTMKKGGAVKKMQNGGKVSIQRQSKPPVRPASFKPFRHSTPVKSSNPESRVTTKQDGSLLINKKNTSAINKAHAAGKTVYIPRNKYGGLTKKRK